MTLAHTDQIKLPRILAINDLSGFSHTSLMAVIPIFQVLGIGVTALPTAVLSSNTEQDGFQLMDLTVVLDGFLQHWSQLKLEFNAIYSGFLSSEKQVKTVLRAIRMFSANKPLVVVDPVMADDGKLYPCFGNDIINSMRKLIAQADLITPNLTEAALLLEETYRPALDDETARNWCSRLADIGPCKVIITSIQSGIDCGKTAVMAYDKATEAYHKSSCSYHPVNYPGTGDIFTTVLTALLIKGDSFFLAIDKTVSFVSQAIQVTLQTGTPTQEGICLEKALAFLPQTGN